MDDLRALVGSRSGLLASLALTLAWFAGCGGEDGTADAGLTTDSGVVTDGGGGGNTDAAAGDTGVEPLPADTFVVHYHRPRADYMGWTLEVTGDVAPGTAQPIAQRGPDGFGVRFWVPITASPRTLTYTLKNGADVDTAGAITVDLSTGVRQAWQFSEYAKALTVAPPSIPGPNEVVVYYQRTDGAYMGWGLHTWGDVFEETLWSIPLSYRGTDDTLGADFVVRTKSPAERINIIVHKGDEKDPGPDMGWNISEQGNIVFVLTGSSRVYTTPQETVAYAIRGAAAHLLDAETLAWSVPAETARVELRSSPTADVRVEGSDFVGGEVITTTPRTDTLAGELRAKFPHLGRLALHGIASADRAKLEDALRGQLVAIARSASGTPLAATEVQLAGVLDALYTYTGPLGLSFSGKTPTFRVWAPTAQAMKLRVYDASKTELAAVDMTRGAQGVWSHTAADGAWYGLYYRLEPRVYHPVSQRIETPLVTDPYSVSLSTNSRYSQIVDLFGDPELEPFGWRALSKPPLEAPEDIVVYEGHVRDFSIWDTSVSAALRGKYLAFTATAAGASSRGMTHLRQLAEAGVTHFHVLPTFDIATVDEDQANRVDIGDRFEALCMRNPAVPMALCVQYAGQTIQAALESMEGDAETQQDVVNYMRRLDGFNWGYDPFHFDVPEGSYATNPEGTARIVELRRMVKALADVGLRVVIDVVYNHTNASGLGDSSVFDKVVPGYYHRRNAETGFVENSTCCQNTATEHAMMEKFMIDSLLLWARAYRIDAFRFDLMGHHMKSNMVAARAAMDALMVAADGVDGRRVYFYGEGWDFGEVAGGQRGQNAVQAVMGGTGIGTFNDRLRDAVRGGSAFDSAGALRRTQGFGTGGFTDANEAAVTDASARRDFLAATDRIKIGMAGNLKTFRINDSLGFGVQGDAIGYNGARTGYTEDPQEVINYVSKHDNQTLWDILQYKANGMRTNAERIRMYNVALDTVLLGQGVPFFHMGDDILRSKSMERDSYDSGDWFNRVDWSYTTNNWRVGLPSREKDVANWPLIRERFSGFREAPSAAQIQSANAHFREMLRVRKSSRLFRLGTGDEARRRVDFLSIGPDQEPGIIAMSITDGTCAGADLDPERDAIFVLINARTVEQPFTVNGAQGFALHSVLQQSADMTVRGARFDAGSSTFFVPARTTAVFEQRQSGGQGAGLPCNAR